MIKYFDKKHEIREVVIEMVRLLVFIFGFPCKYLSQIKFKKLGNDSFSLAYSGLKSPIPNENNMG